MTIKKLSRMPYAQAHIEIDNENNKTFFSYVTRVAEITSEGWLIVYGLYSQTTRKHVGAFVREYADTEYSTAKILFENSEKYNIYTGEIQPV